MRERAIEKGVQEEVPDDGLLVLMRCDRCERGTGAATVDNGGVDIAEGSTVQLDDSTQGDVVAEALERVERPASLEIQFDDALGSEGRPPKRPGSAHVRSYFGLNGLKADLSRDDRSDVTRSAGSIRAAGAAVGWRRIRDRHACLTRSAKYPVP